MTLAQLDKLTAHLPEHERREVLEYARRRNRQAITLAAIVLAFWCAVGAAIWIVEVVAK